MVTISFGGGGKTSIGATIRIGREIWCLPYAGFCDVCILCGLIKYLKRKKTFCSKDSSLDEAIYWMGEFLYLFSYHKRFFYDGVRVWLLAACLQLYQSKPIVCIRYSALFIVRSSYGQLLAPVEGFALGG